MGRNFLIATLAAGLLAGSAAGDEPPALTADQLVAKSIDARGGRDTLQSVRSMRLQGTVRMGAGVAGPFSVEMKRPTSVRVEFTFQDMTGIQAYDGQSGWSVMPFQGKFAPEPMSAEQSALMEQQADIDGPLVDYAKKGHRIELVGREAVDGTDAYALELTKRNGDVDLYYLDAESFLPIKMVSAREFQGLPAEIEVRFADYREVDGLTLAYTIEQRPKGAPAGQIWTIEEVEINPALAADRFRMPAPPAGAPAPAERMPPAGDN